MKGILPPLFLCVTLYLADGHFNSPSQEQDQYHESERHVYREDRNPFLEAVILRLETDMNDESKGSLRTFQRPLSEERVIFLEDRSPSVESAGGFRGSSASSGLGAIFSRSETTLPEFPVVIPSKSDLEQDCFVRQVLDLLNSLVTKVYGKNTEKYGVEQTNPKKLHIMVKELTENLHSVDGIEVLDKALLKYVKVFRIFFRMLRQNFIYQSGESPEMSLALALFSQVELILQDFLDLSAEDSRESVPSIRLLLEFMDAVLSELNEEQEAPWKKYVSHLPKVQRFVKDARVVLEALVKGFFIIKQKSEIKGSVLRNILVNFDTTLKELISDPLLFDNKPGSSDDFLRKMLTAIEKGLSGLLEDFSL